MLMYFSKGFDSIDSLPLTDCKKHKKELKKIRCISAQEPSRSVGVIQTERGSQVVCFLSKYLLYLFLNFKNETLNNNTAFPNS